MTHDRAREIFTGATKLPEEERAAFLDEQCGDDAALRAEVEELLARDHGSTKVETEKYSRFDGYQVGETVGPFKILAHLGEGGFGAVYLAEQTKPVKRRVALKVIKPGMDSKAVLARFDAEQQALALMSHPGIAKVFDAGATPDGRPYFVMEYVKGEPLNEFCDNQKLNTAQRLELFARVCDAIQHAHQKGVIHRDLKPSNILVAIGEHDEPEPKVIDFGIAKATSQQLTEQTIYTQQGQMIGTPEYMSPEQADMRAVDIDIRTDVYSLGVILYELLSGRLPFDPKTLREKGLAEIQRIIREDDPPKPSTRLSTLEEEEGTKIAKARKTQLDALANTLKKELEWIPLRALKKERRERYGSAEALAQDVRRYLSGEPLEAGPDSRAYRLKKFSRRNKGPVIAAALVAAALVAGIIGTSIFAVRAEVKTAEALAAQAKAEEKTEEAQQQRDVALHWVYVFNLHAAEAALNLGNTTTVRRRLSNARDAKETQLRIRLSLAGEHDQLEEDFTSGGSLDHLPFEWQYLNARSDESLTLHGHEDAVNSIAFSPDGTHLVSGGLRTVRLWDVEAGEEIATLRGHEGRVESVAFSPDGTRLASGSTDKTIRLWDVETGDELATLRGHEDWVGSVAFSPDGTRLASGSSSFPRVGASGDLTVRLWDVETSKELATLRGHEDDINSVTFSPDGTRLATGSDDRTVRLWDVEAGEEIATLRGHEGEVESVAFSPDGTRLASGGYGHHLDETIRLWDVETGEEIATLRGHEWGVRSVAFSPDGTRLVSGSLDQTVRLWDIETGEELTTLRGHEDDIRSVAFSPDGTRLASGSTDKTIRLWDVEAGEDFTTLPGQSRYEGSVRSIAYSPDGTRFMSVGFDNHIRVWDAETDEELAILSGHEGMVDSVAFSPDGTRLASESWYDDTIRLWDLETGEELATLRRHKGNVESIAFSPDGARRASTNDDNTVRLWDIETGEELPTLRGHEDGVRSIAFSRDGARVASGSRDKTIRLWDAETGEELATLRGHESGVSSVTFSPDGTRLASKSYDHTIRLWDVVTGKELATLRNHEGWVGSVAFSPDGTRLATGSWDFIIRLWDVETGDELATLRGHESEANSIAFSPDGTRLVSGDSNIVRLWDVETGEELVTLRGHEGMVDSVAFSPDGMRLVSEDSSIVRLWDTRTNAQLLIDRRLARARAAELEPLVIEWVDDDNNNGDDRVLKLLGRESKARPPKEVTTLRNLVLKHLTARRQAQQVQTAEPAEAAAS